MAKQKRNVIVPEGRLWPNTPSGAEVSIDVFGVTGEYKSGKTLLGLSIAPGVHPQNHPFAGQPRTLYIDCEKSGGTYSGTRAKRIDMPLELIETCGMNHLPIDAYKWFARLVNSLQPGQYDVIVVDPITDIEAGLVDYVRTNPHEFQLSPAQITRSAGLMWGAAKSLWKRLLLKIATVCQTFYFTTHLRDEWQGNTATGRREPKGKETLMELASLYLWLERLPNAKGEVPAVPSARVLKDRLSDTVIDLNGQLKIIPLLPPRLPEATPQAIRRYIASPPDYDNLASDELAAPAQESEADLERLRLMRAQAEQATEEARVSFLARQIELQTLARNASQKPQTPSDAFVAERSAQSMAKAMPEDVDESPMELPQEIINCGNELAERTTEPNAVVALKVSKQLEKRDKTIWSQPDEWKQGSITFYQFVCLLDLCEQTNVPDSAMKTACERAGVTALHQLTSAQADKLIERLTAKRDAMASQKGGDSVSVNTHG